MNGMQGETFLSALTSGESRIPKEYDWYAPLLGDWDFAYVDHEGEAEERRLEGEWLFRRALDGGAIEDLFICPSRATKDVNPQPDGEYGAAIRVFHPEKEGYEMVYACAKAMTRLEVRRIGDEIVCTVMNRPDQRWIFSELTGETFRWRNETLLPEGVRRINCRLRAWRKDRGGAPERA